MARAFAKAVRRARALIYIEDQYFWSTEIAHLLAAALQKQPRLQLIVAVPRYPDKDGTVSGPPSRLAQERAMAIVKKAGGDRVALFDVENEEGWPIYVHAKVCVIDDVWAAVGSDNLNRRSWTHDSELSCGVLDAELDTRHPLDPGGLGDGSRRFARDLRIALWAEHLGRTSDDADLVDISHAIATWNGFADSNEPRDATACRVRRHVIEPVARRHYWWASVVYRLIFDPDGRPVIMRRRHRV